MKKTLKTMTAPEVVAHYKTLNDKRFTRANTLAMQSCEVEGEAQRILRRECEKAMDKASAMSRPRQRWHADAARDRLEKYGVMVAAAFLNANGWSKEAAYYVIFGKQYQF